MKNDRLLPGVWSFGAWAVCAHVIRVETIHS
jgi:hypothetical protein